ncbi:MAG: ABC transporter permease [Thermomicrobiales bacterium]|nr:ABC transporter permease [Thermomicrobiales bacterium]
MAASDTNVLAAASVAAAKPKRGLARITPQSRWYWVRMLLQNKVAVASMILLGIIVLSAILAPLIAPHDPRYLDPVNRLKPPSNNNWLGTDDSGRDLFSRILFGGRVSLLIGVSVTVAAAIIGTILGLAAGYFDRLDSWIMRAMDGLMAFPSILLAIAIMVSLGAGAQNVFIALVIVYTPTIARLVRSSTLVLRQQAYVESARSIGMGNSAILTKYIFPNALSPLIVQCTFVIAFSIIAEASLSFLGAGVDPQTPTWGNMLRDGQRMMQIAWWAAIFPGMALVILVLSLNLLGDALRDALDPRVRER